MKEYHEIVLCDIPEELPLLPLTSTAVFPHAVVSLQVRLARSLKLLEEKGVENQIIATAITKKGITVVNSIDDIHRIGVAVRLISKVKTTKQHGAIGSAGNQAHRSRAFAATGAIHRGARRVSAGTAEC